MGGRGFPFHNQSPVMGQSFQMESKPVLRRKRSTEEFYTDRHLPESTNGRKRHAEGLGHQEVSVLSGCGQDVNQWTERSFGDLVGH
jgi:hypothetical protein